ncbi:DMT family transporter [Falsiroseomonas sp.]|uniref:DMT family transporter n=1 Tax=Falsiroseomonas sp. TaxID=2870721 RepID=UPI002722AB8F|nr:DMT family transporter [Falsiroseomonas sp.]MDO9502050.1 DMT family transporter [Falsiroseomonas sp.]
MQGSGLLIAGAFVAIWASAFTVAGVVVKEWPPLWALGIRFGLTVPMLLAILLIMRSRLPRPGDIGRVAVLGLCGMGGYLAFAWLAMARIPTGLVALICATTPLMVAAGESLFLRRPLPGLAWVGLAIGWSGVALLGFLRAVDGLAMAEAIGFVFALGAAISQAVGLLVYAPAKGRVDIWFASFGQTTVSALLCLALALVLEGAPPTSASWPTWAAMGWSMVVVGIGAYALNFAMMRRVPASTAAALQLLAPPLAAVFGWALLSERLYFSDIIGGVLTLGGLALLVHARSRG